MSRDALKEKETDPERERESIRCQKLRVFKRCLQTPQPPISRSRFHHPEEKLNHSAGFI